MTPIEQLEADVAGEEAELQTELDRALAHWRELAARLNTLKDQLAQATGGGMQVPGLSSRVSALVLPELEPGPVVEHSRSMRREAVAARRAAIADVKQRLPEFTASLARLSYKISAEEGAVAHNVDLARAVAREVAAAARKLELAGEDLQPLGRMKPARTQPRVRAQVMVEFCAPDGQWHSGFSTNLSDGGVFIATVRPVAIGAAVKLRFQLPGAARIECGGVVRWVRGVNDKRAETVPGLGVQFSGLSDDAKRAIDAFVRERDPVLE
ncbi:MAG: TIGR02266 family protein [Myxococcaceae bacterium]|nr:TIGR02266 family protein [Myxococcaceae bacterium]